jgi:LIX1-like protein
MDNQSMNQAIEILVNNFTRHPELNLNSDQSNVFQMLQDFWRVKIFNSNGTLNDSDHLVDSLNESTLISYEFLEKPTPPYICFCTLPSGSCFATFQNVTTKHEAKKSAALISLMNSFFNEHPLRRISDEFILKSIDEAQLDYPNLCNISLQLYKRLLETCLNKTMLEFKQMMTVFQLLQWNGSIKAMRERNCHLNEVIEYYKNFKIDEEMRNKMSIDWIDREQKQSGIIITELHKVNNEIEASRLRGQELRFLKEKRNILLLASYQFDIEIKND